MATISRPEAQGSLRDISGELRRVSASYGLRAQTRDPIKNEEVRETFDRRMKAFLGEHLALTKGLPVTRRSISVVIDTKRRPISREIEVPLADLNELTLVWALDLIRFGYRGFTKDGVLGLLKREVIWLFSQHGHSLFGEHTLFCPFLNLWEKQRLWEMLRANDIGEVEPISMSLSVVAPIPECSECVRIHEASK
mgnify:FL=1